MFRYIVPFRQQNSTILTSATQSKSQSSVKYNELRFAEISGEDKKEQVEIQTLNEGALIVDFYI